MQWLFFVLAIAAALVELHTGTFYLAAAAAAALATALIGFWLPNDALIFVFAAIGAILLAGVLLYRRRRPRGAALEDFDVGQIVTITGAPPRGDRVTVDYRGAPWQAVMEDGSVPPAGSCAIIKRKTDKLLHLALPPAIAQK